jgi:hypothetical protein
LNQVYRLIIQRYGKWPRELGFVRGGMKTGRTVDLDPQYLELHDPTLELDHLIYTSLG